MIPPSPNPPLFKGRGPRPAPIHMRYAMPRGVCKSKGPARGRPFVMSDVAAISIRRHEAVVERAADDVVVEAAGVDQRRSPGNVAGEVLERDVQIFEARAPVRRDGVVDAEADRPADRGVVGAEAGDLDGAAAVSEAAGEVGQPAVPNRVADAAAEGAEPVKLVGDRGGGARVKGCRPGRNTAGRSRRRTPNWPICQL